MTDTAFSGSYIESDAELESLIGADPRTAAVALKAATAATQEWHCQEATRHIDTLPLRGRKYDIGITAGEPDQPLQFPRIIDGVTKDWNDDTDAAFVPDDVKRACVEEAIAIYANGTGGRRSLQEQGVQSYQIPGIIAETFTQGFGRQVLESTRAKQIMRQYMGADIR